MSLIDSVMNCTALKFSETYLTGAFPQDVVFPVLQYDAFNVYTPHFTDRTALPSDVQLESIQHSARRCMHRYVGLANNHLKMHGALPSLVTWKKLWYFQMCDHDLTGILPRLPRSLRVLQITSTLLSSAPMIEDMPLLTRLDVSENDFTVFPGQACVFDLGKGNNAFCFWPGVRQCPQLRFFALKNTFVPTFPILSELPSLQDLRIAASKIEGVIPRSIELLTALTFLDLSRNKLRSPLPRTGHKLVNLE